MGTTRKKIAFIASEIAQVYQTAVTEGMVEQAKKCNIDIYVYSSFYKTILGFPENEIGENKIFSLINYDFFDGFVVIPNSIGSKELLNSIEKKLKETKKPVIWIDVESDDFFSVVSDDRSSFREITNHLIREHGYKRINCITGFKDMNLSDNRLFGYFDALKENGIEIEEGRYSYGDFWITSAKTFVEQMFSCGLPLPEAIVCANDVVAVTICDDLAARGYRVPEDIAVTGYDHSKEGIIHTPQICTAEPPMKSVGERAIEILNDVFMGKQVEKTSPLVGRFFPSESCGCSSRLSDVLENEVESYHEMVNLNHYYASSNFMSEDLLMTSSTDECFTKLFLYLHLIEDVEDLFIFLSTDWDSLDNINIIEQENSTFTETMNCVFSIVNGTHHPEITSVVTKDMLPALSVNSEQPSVFYFSPLTFKRIAFGYAMIKYNKSEKVLDFHFRHWIRCVCNTLEHIRSQMHLRWALARLERLSEIDSLTGVYNRLGFENRVHKIFNACKADETEFLAIMGDLDCLKKINDTYGHNEGDNAIRIIAKAFQNSFMEDEFCSRFGGDEFILVGKGVYTDEAVLVYEARINEYLEHYNSHSTKPYIISVSLGFYHAIPSGDDTVKSFTEKADEEMYKNKRSKIKIFEKEM